MLIGRLGLPVEVLRAFEATFGVQILEGYGLSETSPVASFNHRDLPRKVRLDRPTDFRLRRDDRRRKRRTRAGRRAGARS